MDKQLIDKLLLGIRQELEKAHHWFVNFHTHPKETTKPGDVCRTFEPTDHMTITIEINKPDENDRQDRRAEQRGDAVRLPG